MQKYLLAIIITLFSAFQAQADAHVNIVRVSCFSELNILLIEQDIFWGHGAENYMEANPDQAAKQYGLYDINGLIESDYYGKITAYHPKEVECQLGKDKYQIKLLPHTTTCQRQQDYYSLKEAPFRITIIRNNHILVDNLLFAWGDDSTEIKRIYIINGEPYSMRIDTNPGEDSKYYFLDRADFKPVTTRRFYELKSGKPEKDDADQDVDDFC